MSRKRTRPRLARRCPNIDLNLQSRDTLDAVATLRQKTGRSRLGAPCFVILRLAYVLLPEQNRLFIIRRLFNQGGVLTNDETNSLLWCIMPQPCADCPADSHPLFCSIRSHTQRTNGAGRCPAVVYSH